MPSAQTREEVCKESPRTWSEFAASLTPEEKAKLANRRWNGIKDTEMAAGLGHITLTGEPERDSLTLREEFHIQLIEIADRFDHLDHEFGPFGGSELQDDCQMVRELTRKKMHPRFQEAFRRQQGDMLDAEILSGLVAGPDAS